MKRCQPVRSIGTLVKCPVRSPPFREGRVWGPGTCAWQVGSEGTEACALKTFQELKGKHCVCMLFSDSPDKTVQKMGSTFATVDGVGSKSQRIPACLWGEGHSCLCGSRNPQVAKGLLHSRLVLSSASKWVPPKFKVKFHSYNIIHLRHQLKT